MKTECLDTELSVLFALFKYDKKAVKHLDANGIKDKYFANIIHRKVFQIIYRYINKNGKLSLNGFLKYYQNKVNDDSKEILKIKNCLKSLKQNKCKLDDLKPFCEILRNYYGMRQILNEFGKKIDVLDKDFPKQLLSLEKTITQIKNEINYETVRRVMGLKEGLEERKKFVKDIKENPDKHGLIETGFINFDKFISNQTGGNFVLYNSKTNMGKSMFLAHTAVHNWLKGRKVMVITIEMNCYEWLYRIDSKLSKIEHSEFSLGTIIDNQKFMDKWDVSINEVTNPYDLKCYWVPSQCSNEKIRSLIANNPFKPDLVVVDYAGDMSAGLYGVSDYEEKAQAEIYKGLKEIAGDFDVVLYSAQQVKRDVKSIDSESGARTQMAANKADIIIAIECTKEDKDYMYEENGIVYNGRLTLRITKGRNIPKLKTYVIPTFNRMDFIEKEFKESMVTEFSSFKTKKRENQDKINSLSVNNKDNEENVDDDIKMLD
jgi:replicative DNA helicase